MTLESITLRLPRKMLNDAGTVASEQDVSIGHLVRQLLSKEINRRLNPKTSNRTDEGLLAALQALLARDMAEASNWDDLALRLQFHGYELRPAGGGIVLHKRPSGTRVCKGSELGFAYRTLVQRFGKGMPGHPHGALDIEVAEDTPRRAPLNSTVKGRLQRMLEPVFRSSTDWESLIARLARRGFVLRAVGTGTVIYTSDCDRDLCDTTTIGYSYRALVKRFGAPMPGHPYGAAWVKVSTEPPQDSEVPEDDFEVIERDWPLSRASTEKAPALGRGFYGVSLDGPGR